MPSLWGTSLAPSLEKWKKIIISVVMETYSVGLLVSLMCFGNSHKPIQNPLPFLNRLYAKMLEIILSWEHLLCCLPPSNHALLFKDRTLSYECLYLLE